MKEISQEELKFNEYVSEVKDDEAYDYWLENGKEEINKLIWRFLPGSTTLDEAETVATSIYETIDGWWRHKRE